MGCDFYINEVLRIQCDHHFCESETINQTKYYKDSSEGMSIYRQYKNCQLSDKHVYGSGGWLISNEEEINEYKNIVKEKGLSMENVRKLYITQDYVKNW